MSKNIELAKECGDVEIDRRGRETYSFDNYGIERFAHLVEQRTMQECARICETVAKHYDENTGYRRNEVECVPQDGCDDCAATILATSNIKDKP